MRKAVLKVGVYRLRFNPTHKGSLTKIAKTIDGLKLEARASLLRMGDPIRPRDDIQFGDDYFILDFTRIRPVNRIPISDLKGNEGHVVFRKDDRRPCDHTAVLFDPLCNTMYVQEGTGSAGIGHNAIADYMKGHAGIDQIAVEVVLHEEKGLDRLRNKRHKKFTIRIAGVENASKLNRRGEGDAAILEALRVFNAPKALLSFELDKTKEKRRLNFENILETATAFLNWNNDPPIGAFRRKRPVRELVVEAEDEQGDILVNLLEDRIVHAKKVELKPGEEPTDEQRYAAVVEAFERHRGQLRRRYPVNHDQSEGC
jgi:hypothetical protein